MVAMLGCVPFGIWTFIQAAIGPRQCYDYEKTEGFNLASYTIPLYASFWAASGVAYVLAFPVLSIQCFPQFLPRFQKKFSSVAIVLWLLTLCLTVGYGEAVMATFAFKGPNNYLTWLQSEDWTFGQVLAVVMLFYIGWDFCMYPFQDSQHGSTRFERWKNTTFWPWYERLPFLKNCKALAMLMLKTTRYPKMYKSRSPRRSRKWITRDKDTRGCHEGE